MVTETEQNVVATGQGLPRTAANPWREEARKDSTCSHRRNPGCLDFGLLPSRTVREYISVALSHSNGGNLGRQPYKTNILGNMGIQSPGPWAGTALKPSRLHRYSGVERPR